MKNMIEEKLAALSKINSRYKPFIDSDPILKKDFATLMEYSGSSDAMTLQHYQKILSHLIAETHEAAEDNQRMADESPSFLPEHSDAYKNLQERRALKAALDAYQSQYLAEPC